MNDEYELLLDEEYGPILIGEECESFKPILFDFIKCYEANKDEPTNAWLVHKLREQLPDRESAEIEEMAHDIIESIEVNESKKSSLSKAIASGRSKESWFASDVKTSTSAMSMQETVEYLTNLDQAMKNANDSLHKTITTLAGNVNMNPRLDGFIAEQYHAQTFNLKAEATGSPYRAKVLEPKGKSYKKNSVDIVILDGDGKVVRRYQSKYCKDAKATELAFEHGDYRGQQKLVPEDQKGDIFKKSTTVLEAVDGTTSTSLTKSKAEQMRDEAQSGNWNDLNWNEYATKDLALGIGKQAGYAALQGAAIGIGFDVAQKLWNGEEIEADKVVETAITSGADFGLKAAAAGALKVGVEKEIITVIPKGTPASTLANIAFVAVEDIKIIGEMATGKLTMKEGIEKIEQTTVATVAGLASMGKGTAIGAAIGSVFGPVGTAVGGFVGGCIGYTAGSKIGETVVKCAQKVREVTFSVVEKIATGVGNFVSNVTDKVSNFFDRVTSFFG
jgi:hypothetical protein